MQLTRTRKIFVIIYVIFTTRNCLATMCKITQPFYNAILPVLIQGMQLLLAENVVQCDKPRGFQLLFPGKSLLKYARLIVVNML